MSTIRSIVKSALPQSWQRWIYEYRLSQSVLRSKDRPMFAEEILPALLRTPMCGPGADVLYVGTARYTKHYYRMIESKGARCWTIEINPEQGKWGRKGRHTVGSVLELQKHYPLQRFDTVIMTGVLGDGVNSEEDKHLAFQSIASVIKSGGIVVTGNNTEKRVRDVLPLAKPWFKPFDLPGFGSRKQVPSATFVYDVLTTA